MWLGLRWPRWACGYRLGWRKLKNEPAQPDSEALRVRLGLVGLAKSPMGALQRAEMGGRKSGDSVNETNGTRALLLLAEERAKSWEEGANRYGAQRDRAEFLLASTVSQAEYFLSQREELRAGVRELADATEALRARAGAWAAPVDTWERIRKAVEGLISMAEQT